MAGAADHSGVTGSAAPPTSLHHAELQSKLQYYRQKLAERDHQVAALEREVELRGAQLAERDRVAQSFTNQAALRDQLRARLGQQTQRVAELELQLKQAHASARTAATLGAENQSLRARVRELEQALRMGLSEAQPDDLTRIKGIGPKFAAKLVERGVTRFAVLASWTSHDISEHASALKVQPARILRDGWVESAAQLAKSRR